MREQSVIGRLGFIIVLFLSMFVRFVVAENQVSDFVGLHRGFQQPDYRSTYASVQLFSISDLGRIIFPIKKPVALVLSRPGDFEPESELTGSPMIKIRSSGVSIDFNGYHLKKGIRSRTGDVLSFCVAIEVGYSPAELAADTNLEQIENIVIKNGGLTDFEMAIVVHAGVKNVIIENLYIAGSAIGIAFLGTDTSEIASCSVQNVRITGNFRDDSLALQWAKVKIEDNTVASIDSANGGSGIVKGKPGFPALGFGYGTNYPMMQLVHDPVTNLNDAYTYYGIYMNASVNIMLKDVLIKCLGYQGDQHTMVQPGDTVGTVTNPATSVVSINGDAVVGVCTPTIVTGVAVSNSTTIFLEALEVVQLVSALTSYGVSLQSSNNISIKKTVTADLDAHHITTAATPEPIIDANVVTDSSIVNPATLATIASLYTILVSDIVALPTSIPPAIDAGIATCRDAILNDQAQIDTGIGLSALLLYVEQIISNAQCIITAYNTILVGGGTLTPDDSTAFLQASAIVQSATNLFEQAYKSVYLAGRICFGLFFNNVTVVEMNDIMAHRNAAQHIVAGLFAQNSNMLVIHGLACNQNTTDDAGNAAATPVAIAPNASSFGVAMLQVDTVTAHTISANFNSSTGIACGLRGYDIDSFICQTLSSCSNVAQASSFNTGWATGLTMFGIQAFTLNNLNANANQAERLCCGLQIASGSSGEFHQASSNNNQSLQSEVIATLFENCQSLDLHDMQANANNGELQSYGFKFDSCASVDIAGMLADGNFVNQSNTLAEACYGIWLFNPESFFMTKASACYNQGYTLGVGLWAKNAKTFHVSDSNFCLNSATNYLAGETSRCNDDPDASKFLPRDYVSGALGMYLRECCDVEICGVEASKNNGNRAAGIFTLNSSDFVITNCNTSFQSATGNYFIDNPFEDLSFCTFPIPPTQYGTLFGSPSVVDPLNPLLLVPADQINLVKAVCVFMNSMASIGGGGIKNILFSEQTECVHAYTDQKNIVLSWLLIQVGMAKYRLFGSSVGLHLHDCDGFTVKDHFANGNSSTQDNAVGIACSGHCDNHLFDRNRAINNDGWTNSAYGAIAQGKYDLAAVKPFYEALYATTGDTLSNDFSFGYDTTHLYPLASNFNTASYNYYLFEYFYITLDCSCPGGSGVPEQIWFTSPVGGMGVGMLLADCSEHIEVRNMDCANNKGYAGQAFGILLDVCANATLEDNRLYQNYANILGYCSGVADMTLQSSSLMMRNFMFCNRIGKYLNSNYFVPYDPTDPYGLSFPIALGFNGDFSTLYDVSPYYNIEIRFTRPAPNCPCLPNDVSKRIDPTHPSCWEVSGYLETSGSTTPTALQICHTDLDALAPATGALIFYFTETIINAVLTYPAGSQAIIAGAQAGVDAGMLNILAVALATVVNANRTLCNEVLQTLVCNELYTQLNNDPVLLITQEVLSAMIPRKRAHLAGIDYFQAQEAGTQAGVNVSVAQVQAESTAVVAEDVLEKTYLVGGDAALLSARDMYALYNLMQFTTSILTSGDLDAANTALTDQSVPPDPDSNVQASIVRFVALQLLRGFTQQQAVAPVINMMRPYGAIVSDFRASVATLLPASIDAGNKVIDSFFDVVYQASLSGSPSITISEAAVVTAATVVANYVQAGGTAPEGLLLGALQTMVQQSTSFRMPELTSIELSNLLAAPLQAAQDLLIETYRNIVSNALFDQNRKNMIALVAGIVVADEMILSSITQVQAEIDAAQAVTDLQLLTTLDYPACQVVGNIIQGQIMQGALYGQFAGVNALSTYSASAAVFNDLNSNLTDLLAAQKSWNLLVPNSYELSYGSDLKYEQIVWSPDGLLMFVVGSVDGGSGTNPGLLIFNKNFALIAQLSFVSDQPTAVCVHPSGTLLAVGLASGTVTLFDISASLPTLWVQVAIPLVPTHTQAVRTMTFSPNGSNLATSGQDNMVQVSDTSNADPANWAPLCTPSMLDLSGITPGYVHSLAFRDNQFLAIAHSGLNQVLVIDVTQTCPVSPVSLATVNGQNVQYLAFNGAGTQLAVTTDNSSNPACLEVFDVSEAVPSSWTSLATLNVSGATTLATVVYDPSNAYVACIDAQDSALSNQAAVRFFDLTNATPSNWTEISAISPLVFSSTMLGATGLAFNPLGTYLAMSSNVSDLALLDTYAQTPTSWINLNSYVTNTASVLTTSINPAGTQIATADANGIIRIWDATGTNQNLLNTIDTVTYPLYAHTGPVTGLVWSQDGLYLYTIGADGFVKVWSMSGMAPVFVDQQLLAEILNNIAVIRLSGNDYLAVAQDNGYVSMLQFIPCPEILCNTTFFTILTTFDAHGVDPVRSVAFNVAGTALATAGDDSVVNYWDVVDTIALSQTPSLVVTLSGATLGLSNWHALGSSVTCVSITADNNTIISGGDDFKVFLTNISQPLTPAPLSVITSSTAAVRDLQISANGIDVAFVGDDGVLRVYDIATPATPVLVESISLILGMLTSVCFDSQNYRIIVGGQFGILIQQFLNRICIAIAQAAYNYLPDMTDAMTNAQTVAQMAGYSTTVAMNLAQIATNFLIANPSDTQSVAVAGAAQAVSDAILTPLTGQELSIACVANIATLTYPVQDAVNFTNLMDIDTAVATIEAEREYGYLQQYPGDVVGAQVGCSL